MPALVIKDLPAELHRRLRECAEQQHRSMTQQAIVILDQALLCVRPVPAVRPIKGAFPLTPAFIDRARREGRP